MKETATVMKIENERLTLGCIETESCASCGAHGLCNVNARTFEAKNPQGLALKTGDKVEIYMPSGKTVGTAFLVLIVPLLLFILFFQLAGTLLGWESEGMRALAGIAGMASGFLISFLYSRGKHKKDLPVITRLI